MLLRVLIDRVAHQLQFCLDDAVVLVRDFQIVQPLLRLDHFTHQLVDRDLVAFLHAQHSDRAVDDRLQMVHVVLSIFPEQPAPQRLEFAFALDPDHLAFGRKPFVLPDHADDLQLGQQFDESPIHFFFNKGEKNMGRIEHIFFQFLYMYNKTKTHQKK